MTSPRAHGKWQGQALPQVPRSPVLPPAPAVGPGRYAPIWRCRGGGVRVKTCASGAPEGPGMPVGSFTWV